jgi:hypothetical protein
MTIIENNNKNKKIIFLKSSKFPKKEIKYTIFKKK